MRAGLTLAALLAMATPSIAKDFGDHGGYRVAAIEGTSETDRGSCVMAEDDFEGPGSTRLRIFRYIEDPDIVAVSVENYNWTSKADEKYALVYDFGDKYFDREAVGMVDGIYHGFLAVFPQSEFLNLLSKSKRLHIKMGDKYVDKLLLEGSTAGRAAFDRCWTYLIADDRRKASERARWKEIPKDPFAKSNP